MALGTSECHQQAWKPCAMSEGHLKGRLGRSGRSSRLRWSPERGVPPANAKLLPGVPEDGQETREEKRGTRGAGRPRRVERATHRVGLPRRVERATHIVGQPPRQAGYPHSGTATQHRAGDPRGGTATLCRAGYLHSWTATPGRAGDPKIGTATPCSRRGGSRAARTPEAMPCGSVRRVMGDISGGWQNSARKKTHRSGPAEYQSVSAHR